MTWLKILCKEHIEFQANISDVDTIIFGNKIIWTRFKSAKEILNN